MATLVLRITKGSPLTNTEADNNFTNLNNEIATKLNSATYTASDILTKIKTVDGTGSGLDADVINGLSVNTILPAIADKSSVVSRDSSGNFTANAITSNLVGNVTGNATNVTGIVAVANGGTGANTASQALINIGAEPLGNSLAFSIALG